MNTGLSVSRVGGDAQTKAMKAVVRGLRSDIAQYRELAAFAQFGSDLDKATQQQLRRGEKTIEVMKQPQYQPLSLVKEVVIIFAVTNGYLDDIPTPRVKDFERDLFRFMETQYRELADTISKDKKFDKEIEAKARAMIEEFKKTNSYVEAAAEKPAADATTKPADKPAKTDAQKTEPAKKPAGTAA
jgi:F-type H+-transporting ATPase subunit alpha